VNQKEARTASRFAAEASRDLLSDPDSQFFGASAFPAKSFLLALALLNLMWSGCVSTKPKIEAKRDSTYNGKLERVLIVYHNDEAVAPRLGPKFSEEFLSRFSELLAQRGVVSEVVRPNKN